MNYLATGTRPRRSGNRLASVYPSDNFRCSDGDLMLIVGNDEQSRRFCCVLGMPALAEDPRFARNQAGVPASPINDLSQVFMDPQVIAREIE